MESMRPVTECPMSLALVLSLVGLTSMMLMLSSSGTMRCLNKLVAAAAERACSDLLLLNREFRQHGCKQQALILLSYQKHRTREEDLQLWCGSHVAVAALRMQTSCVTDRLSLGHRRVCSNRATHVAYQHKADLVAVDRTGTSPFHNLWSRNHGWCRGLEPTRSVTPISRKTLVLVLFRRRQLIDIWKQLPFAQLGGYPVGRQFVLKLH